MSAALEPLSNQPPITLIPRPDPIRPDQIIPIMTGLETAYEIHPVYVMSGVIPVPVYYFDDLDDSAEEKQDQAAAEPFL